MINLFVKKKFFQYLAPVDEISIASSAIPPGLSLTLTINWHRRPSNDKALSIQRPRTAGLMLPPHRGTTTLEVNIPFTNVEV